MLKSHIFDTTIIRHIIVHDVRPQTPEFIGDISTIFNMILIITRRSTTNIPILPGYDEGGITKLSQLTETMIQVGKYVWKICFKRRLKYNHI